MGVAARKIALAVGLGLFGLQTAGHAATLNQTSDECTGGCGFTTSNVMTITDLTGGVFDIKIQLGAGWQFMGNFGPQTITFALPGIGSLVETAVTVNNSAAGVTNNQWNTAGWAPKGFSGAASTTFTQAAASYGPPGVPSLTNAFQINWNNGSGQAKADGNFIDFTVSNAALTLAALTGTTYFVDVFSGGTGNTGIINFTSAANPIPIPPAAFLFGTALVGMGILGRRRRKSVLPTAA